jgi:hypothetical protein
MSLNRYEQAIFDYWEKQPDERRHWMAKVAEMSRTHSAADLTRPLERELWDYFVERREHVPQLRNPNLPELSRISMLNLAEHLLRIWGPPPKPRKLPERRSE